LCRSDIVFIWHVFVCIRAATGWGVSTGRAAVFMFTQRAGPPFLGLPNGPPFLGLPNGPGLAGIFENFWRYRFCDRNLKYSGYTF
jgi:hypothetical protein